MAPKRARGDEAAPKPESSSTFAAILPPTWKDEVGRWLAQDMPKWDIGGFVVGELSQHAMLLGKSEGVLAGVPFATQVFHESGCGVEWLKAEGHYITAEEATAKQPIARVTGPTRCILIAERTALNILSRASGVASAAHAAMAVARQHKWHGKVAGTRKTTPGFGLVEKYAPFFFSFLFLYPTTYHPTRKPNTGHRRQPGPGRHKAFFFAFYCCVLCSLASTPSFVACLLFVGTGLAVRARCTTRCCCYHLLYAPPQPVCASGGRRRHAPHGPFSHGDAQRRCWSSKDHAHPPTDTPCCWAAPTRTAWTFPTW
jgi:hypothetical protein